MASSIKQKYLTNSICKGTLGFKGVDLILDKNPELIKPYNGTSPLSVAAQKNNFAVVKLLVEKYNISVNPINDEIKEYCALERAVHFENYDIAKYLLEKGAKTQYLSIESRLKLANYLGANYLDLMDYVVKYHEMKNPDFLNRLKML